MENEGSDIIRATWAMCLRSKPARDLHQCLQWATTAPRGLRTALNSFGGDLRGRAPHPLRAPSHSEHREELAQRPPDAILCQSRHSLSNGERAPRPYSTTTSQTLRHLPDEEAGAPGKDSETTHRAFLPGSPPTPSPLTRLCGPCSVSPNSSGFPERHSCSGPSPQLQEETQGLAPRLLAAG